MTRLFLPASALAVAFLAGLLVSRLASPAVISSSLPAKPTGLAATSSGRAAESDAATTAQPAPQQAPGARVEEAPTDSGPSSPATAVAPAARNAPMASLDRDIRPSPASPRPYVSPSARRRPPQSPLSASPSVQPVPSAKSNPVPAPQVVDIAVAVPPAATVPLALVGVSEADGFTTSEVQMINGEADKFLIDVSQAGTVTHPDATSWKRAQQASDELFRTWYGQDAYMAMTARRYFQPVSQTSP